MSRFMQVSFVWMAGLLLVACGSHEVATGTGPGDEGPLSPLFQAIDAGDIEAVKAELTSNPTLMNQPQGKRGQTPLHRAVSAGRVEIARLLLENGANVNATDVFGQTPLFVATESKASAKMLELLEQYGAED